MKKERCRESELKAVYERIPKLPSEVGSVSLGGAFWLKDRKTFIRRTRGKESGDAVPVIAFGHMAPPLPPEVRRLRAGIPRQKSGLSLTSTSQ